MNIVKKILPTYLPLLSVAPSEINALSELPEKDKDMMLPYFPLKGWLGSKKLENTPNKIGDIFKNREWIADIDYDFLRNNKILKKLLVDGKYPREVYEEVLKISLSNNGYENWIEYCESQAYIIPCIQLDVISELKEQCTRFNETNKKLALRLKVNEMKHSEIVSILEIVCSTLKNQLFIIIDLGQVSNKDINKTDQIATVVNTIIEACHQKTNCYFSLSGTSFPSSFSGISEGESSINERTIYNKVSRKSISHLIYSDYASVSTRKAGGASRLPPPRIDYPRKNEWKHLRKDFDDVDSATKEDKHKIYSDLAKALIKKDYWDSKLLVWGTQQIEKTAAGDNYGITDAQKATAARINIHLFQQLHYQDVIDDIDTDDDWVD
ncbi:beta family protein [Shewanella algae]|uniref:beta family protein n=1 Tax=Shewanella algae TaxID=38313 RepID=UPI001AADF99C|nr:beta family protein [Shewanella algae]QTE81016.1 beta family protein [Shewanella algae]